MAFKTRRKDKVVFRIGDTQYSSYSAYIKALKTQRFTIPTSSGEVRSGKFGADVGVHELGNRDVSAEAIRMLRKYRAKAVAQWLSQELGRTVTVEAVYAQLSRYRGSAKFGRVGHDEGVTNLPGPGHKGVKVPTPLEQILQDVTGVERKREEYAELTDEDKIARRPDNTRRNRIYRVRIAVKEGRIPEPSPEELEKYASGELKLPMGRPKKSESKTPSEGFFEDSESGVGVGS